MARRLTEKQLAIYAFLKSFMESHGVSPRIEDVAKSFGISGPTAYDHLRALEKKGYIKKYKYYERSIEILEA